MSSNEFGIKGQKKQKSNVAAQAHHISCSGVTIEGSQVQGMPWLHGEFEAGLGNMAKLLSENFKVIWGTFGLVFEDFLNFKKWCCTCMVGHSCDISTQESEAGKADIQSQLGLQHKILPLGPMRWLRGTFL